LDRAGGRARSTRRGKIVEPFGATQLPPPFVFRREAAGFPGLCVVCFGFSFDLQPCASLNEDRAGGEIPSTIEYGLLA